MSKKPTYKELEQRVKELENQAVESKWAEERIEFSAKVLETSPLSVIATDTNAKISYVNPATEKLYGYMSNELIGKDANMLSAEPDKVKIKKGILDTLRQKDVWRGE